MQRQRVDSTSIAEVGYDAASRVLELRFRNGSRYRYYDVPAALHAGLLRAPSIGRYVNANVREAFRYERLGR